MLSVQTSSSSPLTALLPPTAVQAGTHEAPPRQPSFAKMLENHQAPATPVDKATVETKAPTQSQAAPAHAAPATSAPPARPAPESAQPRDAGRAAAKPAETHHADAAAPSAVDGQDEGEDKGDTRITADPALADWLAGLNLPGPATAATPLPVPATDAASGTPAPRADAAPAMAPGALNETAQAAASMAAGSAAIVALGGLAVAGSATASVATASAGRPDTHGPTPAGSARNADTGARAAARDGSETSLLALATKADAAGGQPGAGTGGGDAGHADHSAPAPVWSPLSPIAASASTPIAFMPTAPNNITSQPVAVNLPTPLYSPEFPQAMGAQLTLLAQGGVEHAELHLNPAEMGPVSVQIVMDGTQARIDFGADTASTRQAIEASLPELASALRDAGLTLSGGGVSQHSRGRQEMADAQGAAGGRGNGAGRSDGNTGLDVSPAPLRRSVRVGGVDAYA